MSKLKISLAVLLLLLLFYPMSTTFITPNSLRVSVNSPKIQEFEITTSFDWDLTGTPIYIDDTIPGSNWSYTAATYAWCSGSGTMNDPYVIENVLIDGLNSSSCITILNSNQFFTIRNCNVYNAGAAGIFLLNTSNGTLLLNNCSYNNGYGIRILGGENNRIIDNIINHNYAALWIANSHYITISLNVVNNNDDLGIYCGNCNDGEVSENTLKSNYGGLYYSGYNGTLTYNTLENHTYFGLALEWAYNSFVQENSITKNNAVYGGIIFSTAVNNTAFKNSLRNNSYGIYFIGVCYDNIIKENLIENNDLYGFSISSGSDNNSIFKNCFIGNKLHATDNGIGNHWDNGFEGNYWDNYTGLDNNDDGIGDIPYNISGSAGSQDNFPLMVCSPEETTSNGGIPGFNVLTILIIGMLAFLPILKKRRYKLK